MIIPHNSGAAPIRQVRLISLVAENVRRYSPGLPLMNAVDQARNREAKSALEQARQFNHLGIARILELALSKN